MTLEPAEERSCSLVPCPLYLLLCPCSVRDPAGHRVRGLPATDDLRSTDDLRLRTADYAPHLAHVSLSMRIDVTLIVGAFAADGFTAFALGGFAPVADGSRVPVIST